MNRTHHYHTTIKWTGNQGVGTQNYKAYKRDFELSAFNKLTIPGSSDPKFLGDKSRYNPEEFLVASLSSCHMLWYLHLCSEDGVVVINYIDYAEGIMIEDDNGSGRFEEVILKPHVIVKEEKMIKLADELHSKASKFCFIANSVNFKVSHQPTITVS